MERIRDDFKICNLIIEIGFKPCELRDTINVANPIQMGHKAFIIISTYINLFAKYVQIEDAVSRAADGTSGVQIDFSSLRYQLGPLAAVRS